MKPLQSSLPPPRKSLHLGVSIVSAEEARARAGLTRIRTLRLIEKSSAARRRNAEQALIVSNRTGGYNSIRAIAKQRQPTRRSPGAERPAAASRPSGTRLTSLVAAGGRHFRPGHRPSERASQLGRPQTVDRPERALVVGARASGSHFSAAGQRSGCIGRRWGWFRNLGQRISLGPAPHQVGLSQVRR